MEERNTHVSLIFLCFILDNPFASWNVNLWKYWHHCGGECVCACSPMLAWVQAWCFHVFIILKVSWSRKEEEGGFWKRSSIEEMGCELVLTMKAVGFLWPKMERLISFRSQPTPPGVLITALERGSGHFLWLQSKQTVPVFVALN